MTSRAVALTFIAMTSVPFEKAAMNAGPSPSELALPTLEQMPDELIVKDDIPPVVISLVELKVTSQHYIPCREVGHSVLEDVLVRRTQRNPRRAAA